MKKWLSNWMTNVVALLLVAAAPASLLAVEYSLEDLCRIALTQSEKLKVAEENLTISEIGKDKALSYLMPRLTAAAGYTQYTEQKISGTSVIQPEYGSSWSVRLDETVSLSGRELTALGISRQYVTKSRHELTAIREDYLLRYVAAAYYNVLMARKSLDIADANLDRLTKYRNAAEQRLKIGEVTRTVLLRAEGELSGAKSDQLQARNGLELAMAVLASNCGIKDPFTLREVLAEEGEIPVLDYLSGAGLYGPGGPQEPGSPEADRRGSDPIHRGRLLAQPLCFRCLCRGRSVPASGKPQPGEHLRRCGSELSFLRGGAPEGRGAGGEGP